jgi:hypothetical protein
VARFASQRITLLQGVPRWAEIHRSFLRLKPDYTVEYIWIMSRYQACKREDIEDLIRTPAIRSLISDHMTRVNELLKGFRDAEESSDINDDKSP